MNEKDFDKIFRDGLKDHISPVRNDMWQRIHPEKDKDRKIFFLPKPYMLVAALLLLTAAGWWLISSNIKTSNPSVVAKKDEAKSTGQKQLKHKFQRDSSALLSKQIPSTNNKNINEKSESERPEKALQSVSSNQKNNLNNQNKSFSSSKDILNESNSSQSITNKDVYTEENFSSSKKSSQTNTITDSLAFVDNIQKKSDHLSQKEEKAQEASSTEEEKPDQQKNKWFIEAFASPELTIKQTSENKTSAALFSAVYLSQKKATESNLLSFSWGIRAGIQFNDHFNLKAGLHYTQVNEKFSYTSNANMLLPVTTERYVPDPFALGGYSAIPDSTGLLAYGYRKITASNTFTTLSIPLLATYQTNGSSIKFAFTAGPVINLHAWHSGQILDPYTFKPVPVNSTGMYKNSTSIAAYVGISILKKINNRTELFAEPHLQYNFNYTTKSYATFKEKVHNGGIAFGLRYNLK